MSMWDYRHREQLYEVQCPEHPDAQIVEDYKAGDQICTVCGLVVGHRVIDLGSEWRTFSNERPGADPSRVGSAENPLLNGSDLTTMIAGGKGSAAFDEFGVPKYQNRQQLTQRSVADKALMTAFREVTSMADRLNLPKGIVDLANTYFKKVYEKEELRTKGRPVAYAAACVYMACRFETLPRTFKEICENSKVPKKEIGKCFKIVQSIVDDGEKTKAVKNEDFVSRFCSNLALPKDVEQAANRIVQVAEELDLVLGRSPISVIAGAIYMASQASTAEHKRTPKQIGEAVGVADVTIRQAYRLLHPKAEQLFPEDFKFGTPVEHLPLV